MKRLRVYAFAAAWLTVMLAGWFLIDPPEVRGQAMQQILMGLGTSTPASTPAITGQTLTTLRNNFSGCVGFTFTVGASPITVTDLGRWVVSGNSATHLIVLNGTGVNVSGTVNTSGATAGAYTYISITPTVLAATVGYFISSVEVNGGDQWYDNDSVLTSTAAISVTHAGVNTNPPACNSGGGTNAGANNSYVPPNFKYHL